MGEGERTEGWGARVCYLGDWEQWGGKRTVAGEIEIGMPKRIWAASFSEAEHPRERERETWLG